LTQSTADGLRVTIKSMLELSKYLLEKCGFKYVLTYKMNQDRLEVFYFYKFVDDRIKNNSYMNNIIIEFVLFLSYSNFLA